MKIPALVCRHEFGPYAVGQMVTDPDEIAKLRMDRDHHFASTMVDVPDAPTDDPAPARAKAK